MKFASGCRMSSGSDAPMAVRSLKLHLCTDITADEERLRPFVKCPRKAAVVEAHDCAGCMRMRSIEWTPTEGGEVRCFVAEPERGVDPRSDFAERAARTEVITLIAPVATCISPDVPGERVRALLSRGVAALAVIDRDSRLLGLVTRATVGATPSFATASDVMTETDRVLPEQAPVSAALALFAGGDHTPVPIAKADGTVLGLCEVGDVLRWVAGELGFVATPP